MTFTTVADLERVLSVHLHFSLCADVQTTGVLNIRKTEMKLNVILLNFCTGIVLVLAISVSYLDWKRNQLCCTSREENQLKKTTS